MRGWLRGFLWLMGILLMSVGLRLFVTHMGDWPSSIGFGLFIGGLSLWVDYRDWMDL